MHESFSLRQGHRAEVVGFVTIGGGEIDVGISLVLPANPGLGDDAPEDHAGAARPALRSGPLPRFRGNVQLALGSSCRTGLVLCRRFELTRLVMVTGKRL
jgi:hypothetical protein